MVSQTHRHTDTPPAFAVRDHLREWGRGLLLRVDTACATLRDERFSPYQVELPSRRWLDTHTDEPAAESVA
jgi:hypothetical protein